MIAALSRPGTLAAPLAVSLFLHLVALAWLQPRSTGQTVLPTFDLSVRLARPEAPAVQPPPRPPAARVERHAAKRPAPLPPQLAAAAEPPEAQPLRTRIVADPAEYGLASEVAGRSYAWPGALTELPFPPQGLAVRYPEDKRRQGVQGLVVIRLAFSRLGALEDVQVICSSPDFDSAVLEAVHAARFLPPLSANGPVPAWGLLEFAFLADRDSTSSKEPRNAERALTRMQESCLRR